MNLQTAKFMNCCNATIIHGFGGTNTAEKNKGEIPYAEMLRQLQDIVRRKNFNMLVAITNDQQKTAVKVLRECGFEWTPWMSKVWHNETRIRLWFKRPDTVRFNYRPLFE